MDIGALLRPPAQKQRYFITTKDGKQAIDPDLVDAQACALAQRLADAKLENTQLRRFFGPVLELRQRVQAGRVPFEQLKAELALMKARCAYSFSRPNVKVPAELVQFFAKHAHSIESIEDFKAFCLHFEAVVAYHRAYKPK